MDCMNRLFAGWVLLCGLVIASSAATNGIEVVKLVSKVVNYDRPIRKLHALV